MLCLSFTILLAHALTAPYEEAGPDGLTYERSGRHIAETGAPFHCDNFGHAYWSPAWILTIAALYRRFGPHHKVIRVFLVVVAIGTAALIHLLTNRLAGKRAACAAATFFLFSTLVYRFTVYYQYELPLAILVLAAFALVARASSRRDSPPALPRGTAGGSLWRALCSGLLFGIAALISPRVLALLAIVGVYLFRREIHPSRTRAVFAFAAGLFLVIAPWALRNHRCYDEWILTTTNGGINFYIANNAYSTGDYGLPPRDVLPAHKPYESGAWYREAFRYIRNHPGQTALRSLAKAGKFWNPHYGDQGILLAAFIAGLVRIRRSGARFRSSAMLWILGVPAVLTAVHMLFFVQPRYFIPLLPSVAMIAGIGLGGIAPRSALGAD